MFLAVLFDEISRKWTVRDEPNETVMIDDRLLMSPSYCIVYTCTQVFTVILKGLPGRF